MGAIIRMDSKKFIKDLIPTVNHDEFQFILISQFIQSRGEFKNVKALPRLMPPNSLIHLYLDGDKKEYKKQYANYLKSPEIDAFISIVVKAAVTEDMKIVLLCSHTEDEYGYLKMLTEYIEAAYQVKTHTWKDYNKNPDKVSLGDDLSDTNKILEKKFSKMKKNGVDLEARPSKKQLQKELKGLGKKELKHVAKTRGLKFDKKLGKKELAKDLAKQMAKAPII